MAALSTASRLCLRAGAKPAVPAVRALSSTAMRSDGAPSYSSPFKGETKGSQIPDFGKYMSAKSESGNKVFSYFMVGAMGALTAAGAKSTVQEFLVNMSASADVLAMAKAEVDLNTIPEGKNVIIKWRGKPVFIRHRTADEIAEANKVEVSSLRDPQSDDDRVQKPEWLVMLGVCTHLGCVPIGEAGDYGGWIPSYEFPEDDKLIIG
ncbi:hypothetical protein LLEC1_01203 [Akanthomyces lecanii]|uniref:Cytochrome b-c1 complex subunit Rieske, mitochondrial n=1 Tax=Cordyceps confragosa TaxID=2714763 RepID=A0A179I4L5_CORDF|nr:hypothetical protein LLEC1_01203 [Akanthomyces lecanii]